MCKLTYKPCVFRAACLVHPCLPEHAILHDLPDLGLSISMRVGFIYEVIRSERTALLDSIELS